MSARGLPSSPYPGLRPFKKDEWAIFFGREVMIDAVLDRLAARQLVFVHGSSGCGKSSLIKAGVLPRLEQEHSLHGVPWQTAEMRPGGSPLWHLAEAIARLIERLPEGEQPSLKTTRGVHRLLNLGETALTAVQDKYALGKDGNVCLLIDQFEELFRYAREIGREEAETLIDVLKAFGGNDAPKGIHAIVTMRSDHLGDCAQFTGFAELVNQTQYLLPRMDKTALMRAISEPARLYGGEVRADLALRMIDESQNETDALPLVQHCLMRLWREQLSRKEVTGLAEEGALPPGLEEAPAPLRDWPRARPPFPVLTTDGYIGLQPILSQHADEVLGEIIDDDAAAEGVAEHLFRAITEIDPEGRGIRHPMRRSQLLEITGYKPETLDRIIERFDRDDCGFVIQSGDDDPLIDISHEALIRCWLRLNNRAIDKVTKRPLGWLQREQEDARIWRSLLVQAEAGEEISTGVLRERLDWLEGLAGKEWAERHGGGWNDVQGLVERSEDAREAVRQRAEEEQRREEASRRKDQQIKRGLTLAVGLFLFLTTVAVSFWLQARSTAEEAQLGDSLFRAEQARQEIREGRPVTAMQLALAGLPDDPALANRPWVGETAGALIEALGAQQERQVLEGHQGRVLSVAFSPDGQRIASGGEDQTIRIWDAETGESIKTLDGHQGTVWSVAFSPDGQRIASGGLGQTIRIWDAETGESITTLDGHQGWVLSVAFSPDGQRVASGADDRTIRIWDAETGESITTLEGHQGRVLSVAFSPDGQRIGSGGEDGTVRIWDAETGESITTLEGHQDWVWSVAFSPDGQRVASGADDRTVRIWDAETGESITTLEGHQVPVRSVAFSPDGQRIGSGGDDRKVRIWDAETGESITTLDGHQGEVLSVAFSPDGKRIGSGAVDQTIRVTWVGESKQALVERARARLPREMTDAERRRFYLSVD